MNIDYNLLIIIGVIAFLLYSSIIMVGQQNIAIIERFGKFSKMASPGLNFVIPFIDKVQGEITLRIIQLDVDIETKTSDDVFVQVTVSIQYFVRPDKVYEAFYKLSNPRMQIRSFVFDVVRARVPKIKLDDVFEKKDDIAIAVKSELSNVMEEFGYGFVKALVTDINPDEKVKEAMNDINAAKRRREAATEKGEAEKIMVVKAAEADAESKALEGKGIADQRKAIIDGLRESVYNFKNEVTGVTSQDVMNLVLLTQYFDTLKEVGSGANSNTLMIPHSPGALGDLVSQLRNAVIIGNEASKDNCCNDKK